MLTRSGAPGLSYQFKVKCWGLLCAATVPACMPFSMFSLGWMSAYVIPSVKSLRWSLVPGAEVVACGLSIKALSWR